MALNGLCDDYLNYEVVHCNKIETVQFFDNPLCDLNLIHLNIRSINKNYNNLIIFLESLNKNFDIIVCSETGIIEDPKNFELSGYTTIYNESRFTKCDGCIVFVKNSILIDYHIVKVTNSHFIHVNLCKNDIKIGLSAIYRSPSVQLESFLENLNIFLENIFLARTNDQNNIEIFGGDININILDRGNTNVENYIDSLNEKGFHSVINQATRIDKNSSTCIDHLFVRIKSDFRTRGVILDSGFSDHCPILLNIFLKEERTSVDEKRYSRTTDFGKLDAFLTNERWNDILNCEDVNTCTNLFIDKLKKHLNDATTIKYLVCKKRKIKPWITQGLLNSIRHRDHLKKLATKNPNNVEHLNRFREYRKYLTKSTNKAKAEYYRNLFESNKNDSKKTWSLIRSSCNNVDTKHNVKNIINENNQELFDELDIANEFNNFFSKIGKRLASGIPKYNGINLNDNSPKNVGSLFFAPIRKTEMIEVINSLNNINSTGSDGVSVNFLKHAHEVLLIPLLHIVNIIFREGIYPNIFKNSIITPLHKGGSKKDISNYRPIAINSNISKIIEKCIKLRLVSYLESFNLLSSNQYGFRQGLGTEDAIVKVIDYISKNLNQGRKCLLIFLDLAKAFDTVSHHILLDRMKSLGIRGIALDLFKSYLNARSQQVKLGDSLSKSCAVECGVPQGTVLGPVLFTIFINGLFQSVPGGDVVCYADDTVIMLQDNTWDIVYKKAEVAMTHVKSWFDDNLLTLNVDKSNYMCFTLNKRTYPCYNTIKIHTSNCHELSNCNCSQKISLVPKTKYLGLYFDSHMKWQYHVEYITTKLRKMYYKFYQIRDWLPKKNLINVYRSLAESVLNYGLVAWGAACESVLSPLVIAQKRILKIILFKNRRFSTEHLFDEARVLNLEQLYIKGVCRLLLSNKYMTQVVSHQITTRAVSFNLARFPSTSFSSIQKSLHYIAPKIFNIIPSQIKNRPYKYNKTKIIFWLLENKIKLPATN